MDSNFARQIDAGAKFLRETQQGGKKTDAMGRNPEYNQKEVAGLIRGRFASRLVRLTHPTEEYNR